MVCMTPVLWPVLNTDEGIPLQCPEGTPNRTCWGSMTRLGFLVARSSAISRKYPSTIALQLYSEEGGLFLGVTLGPVSGEVGRGHNSTVFISFMYCVLVRFLLKKHFHCFREV